MPALNHATNEKELEKLTANFLQAETRHHQREKGELPIPGGSPIPYTRARIPLLP